RKSRARTARSGAATSERATRAGTRSHTRRRGSSRACRSRGRSAAAPPPSAPRRRRSPTAGAGRRSPDSAPRRPRPGTTSEGVREPLQPATALRDDVERHLEAVEVATRCEPRLRRLPQAPLLLRPHHLDRVAVLGPRLRLYLDEHDSLAAPHDEVELVPAGPGVGVENPVAAQKVLPAHAPLHGRASGAGAQSSP